MTKEIRLLTSEDLSHIRDLFLLRQNDYVIHTWTQINTKLVDDIESNPDNYLVFGLFEDDVLDTLEITKPVNSYCWNMFFIMHRGNENRETYIDSNDNKIDVNDRDLRNYVIQYYESTGRHAYYTAAPKPFYDINKFYADYRQNTHYSSTILEEIPPGELTKIEFHKQFVFRQYDTPMLIIHKQFNDGEQ